MSSSKPREVAALDPERSQRIQLLALPVGGALLGIILGLILSPFVKGEDFASPSFWFGGSLLFALIGGVLVLRNRGKPKPRADARPRPAAAAAPQAPAAFTLEVSFPGIAERYPDVWGLDEPLEVRVRGPAAHAGAPVTLVGLREGAEHLRQEGALGPDGTATFTLHSSEPVSLHLEARAETAAGAGRGGRAIRFARYEDEIKTTFAEFRTWALEKIGREERPGLTAREILAGLKPAPDAAKLLAEILYVLEVLSYGERHAERGLYLHFLDCFMALEETGFFGPGGA